MNDLNLTLLLIFQIVYASRVIHRKLLENEEEIGVEVGFHK